MWQTFTQWMSDWSFFSILIRLLLAWVIGFVIGIDRERRNRSAGIRTHVLVCIGAALVMMTGQFIFLHFPDANGDVARLGAQVISGIGFLGAGTILVTKKLHVRGLTTAAGLWACACAGLAIGIGFIEGTIIAVSLIIVTLRLVTVYDKRLHRNTHNFDLYVEFKNNQDVRALIRLLHEKRISFTDFNLIRGTAEAEGPAVTVSVELPTSVDKESFLADIQELPGIAFFEAL